MMEHLKANKLLIRYISSYMKDMYSYNLILYIFHFNQCGFLKFVIRNSRNTIKFALGNLNNEVLRIPLLQHAEGVTIY